MARARSFLPRTTFARGEKKSTELTKLSFLEASPNPLVVSVICRTGHPWAAFRDERLEISTFLQLKELSLQIAMRADHKLGPPCITVEMYQNGQLTTLALPASMESLAEAFIRFYLFVGLQLCLAQIQKQSSTEKSNIRCMAKTGLIIATSTCLKPVSNASPAFALCPRGSGCRELGQHRNRGFECPTAAKG